MLNLSDNDSKKEHFGFFRRRGGFKAALAKAAAARAIKLRAIRAAAARAAAARAAAAARSKAPAGSRPANMNLFPNGKKLRLKTWRNNYIMMVNNGTHVKQGGAGNWETFTVKRLPQFGANCVALYGWHKRYLRAHGNKKTIDQSAPRSNYNDFPSGWGWERFWLEDVGGGKIALRTYHGTYVRANSNGWMDQSPTVPKGKPIPSNWAWEKFTPMFIGGAPKPAPKPAHKPAHKPAPKSTTKTAEYTQSNVNLSDAPNVSTNVSEIQLSGADESVGSTKDLDEPNMEMKADFKDDTEFELFTNDIETYKHSNLLLAILVCLFLITICNLK